MGAHKSGDIDKYGGNGKSHGHPSVMGESHGVFKMRSRFKHFPHNQPYIPVWNKRYQSAYGRQYPRSVDKIFMVSGIAKKP